ncbi:hypothetical protein [Blastopirellula marina]|uniref:Uncharacterized protein n=1 Tax=Blastopirellula marina TaxID=124 RepID=A0A2S8F4P7_9BACT|nr:hypothetical protein [Blastopirellula marina]PQO27131.1 hypothetical protein C5Y98_28190 [Blastopirellula marina]PTL41278.1 hypothetical protein C5Y97_28205 [Blastopirellula marina]
MNVRQLGIALGIGWLLLPLVACAGALVLWKSNNEFTWAGHLFAAVISLPLILGTAIFSLVAIRRLRQVRSWKRLSQAMLLLPILLTVGYAVWLNASPQRITPDSVTTSPGDFYFEYAPQTAFGFPFPFYRIYDQVQPDQHFASIGQNFFDFSSLLGNMTFWSFPVYLIVVVAFLELPRSDEESVEPEMPTQPLTP